MRNLIDRFWLHTLLVLFTVPLQGLVWAQELAIPPLTAQVVDTTGTLNAQQQTELIVKLQAFEASKGSQIAVLLVPSTQPESIEQYALRVAENWKIGRKGIDDGAILVVALQDRTLRIEVGYGLEGALTDISAKRIIEEIIVPQFRQGNVAGGIQAGVDQMIKTIEGEPLPEPEQPTDYPIADTIPVVFVVLIAVGAILRKMIGKLPAAVATGGLVFVVCWLFVSSFVFALLAAVVAVFLTLFGGSAAGFGGGRGSLGGGGFGRGGGFGGGGGGFGGGGASGRW